jgi:membrane-associated phospholipid phosphatase
MNRLLMALAVSGLPYPLTAQSSTTATTPTGTTVSSGNSIGKSAQIAAAAGGILFFSMLIDNGIHLESQEWRGPVSDGIASVGNQFGNGQHILPILGAAWAVGALMGNDRVKDVAGHSLQAGLAAGVVATSLKFITGRNRPNSETDNDHFDMFRTGDTSFPSGHTAVAFGLATALSQEFKGRWDDVGLYGLATLTGLSRINDNKHWFSDVVAGAAVGVVAGRWSTRSHRAPTVVAGPGGVGLSLHF